MFRSMLSWFSCCVVLAHCSGYGQPFPFEKGLNSARERVVSRAVGEVVSHALELVRHSGERLYRHSSQDKIREASNTLDTKLLQIGKWLDKKRDALRKNKQGVRRPRVSAYEDYGTYVLNIENTHCHFWCWVAITFDLLSMVPFLYGRNCLGLYSAVYMLVGFLAALDSGLNVADSVLTLTQMALGIDWGLWQPNARDEALKMWHGLHAVTGLVFAVPVADMLGKNLLFWMDQLTFNHLDKIKAKPSPRLRTFFWLVQAIQMTTLATAADMAYGEETRIEGDVNLTHNHPLYAKDFRTQAIRAMYLTMISASTLGYGDETFWTDAGKYAALPMLAVTEAAFASFLDSLSKAADDNSVFESVNIVEELSSCNLFKVDKDAELTQAVRTAAIDLGYEEE